MARKILPAAQRPPQQPYQGQPRLLDRLAYDGLVAPYDARSSEREARQQISVLSARQAVRWVEADLEFTQQAAPQQHISEAQTIGRHDLPGGHPRKIVELAAAN